MPTEVITVDRCRACDGSHQLQLQFIAEIGVIGFQVGGPSNYEPWARPNWNRRGRRSVYYECPSRGVETKTEQTLPVEGRMNVLSVTAVDASAEDER